MSRPFSVTINAEQLKRGLRTSKRSPRNAGFLVECDGMVGEDGVLQALDEITRLATTEITDGFPFPQLFVFTNIIIVCGLTKVYEWDGSSLVLKYTASDPAGIWSAADFYDYVYMSNGNEAVVRDAGSKAYAQTTELYTATTICNYNGQVLIGAPDVDGLGANITIPADAVTLTLTPTGEIS